MKFLKTSQFFRGVLATLSLLAMAPEILDGYTSPDLAAGVHAVIVGWNVIAESVGSIAASILQIPDIPAEFVNALVLGFTISPPWVYRILSSEWGQHRGVVQNTAFWVRATVGFVQPFVMALFLVSAPLGSIIFFITLAGVLVPFLAVLQYFDAYRKGFFFMLGALVAVEVVYMLSTDSVQALFDDFVCEHQDGAAPRCGSSNRYPKS